MLIEKLKGKKEGTILAQKERFNKEVKPQIINELHNIAIGEGIKVVLDESNKKFGKWLYDAIHNKYPFLVSVRRKKKNGKVWSIIKLDKDFKKIIPELGHKSKYSFIYYLLEKAKMGEIVPITINKPVENLSRLLNATLIKRDVSYKITGRRMDKEGKVFVLRKISK